MNEWIITNVYSWLANPAAWLSWGPIAQIILVLLFALAILQAMPNSFAGGTLFNKTGCWITLLVLAVYATVVCVIPFFKVNFDINIPVIWILAIVALVVLAVLAKKNLH